MESIISNKEKEIENMFQLLNNEQALTMAALSMERMWMPFKKDLSVEAQELLQYSSQCLDMIWDIIIRIKILPNEYSKFKQVVNHINVFFGDDINFLYESSYSDFFLSAISSGSGWFFNESNSINKRYGIVISTLDMITTFLTDTLPEEDNKDYFCKIEGHPDVLAEIERIDEDYQLVKGYPENIEEILKKKSYYHNLMILNSFDK